MRHNLEVAPPVLGDGDIGDESEEQVRNGSLVLLSHWVMPFIESGSRLSLNLAGKGHS